MIGLPSARRDNTALVAVFCIALLAHFYFATSNWTSSFLPGHEFRQTQTALISHYIDEQNNFSLLYETPVLGKPWVSILLEVPIYEWAVVLVSRVAHVPHFIAARTVSLVCFYLALPPLYLLLGRLGLPRPRRLLPLALILVCPVYLFYSRAFLMESMAVMGCAWFLAGFVRTMDGRSWPWLVLTMVAGTAAALIKSATFAVWLLPAAGYGFWLLGRDLRAGAGGWVPLRTAGWGLATVAVPLGALQWWISYTDPIKAAHPSAWIFTAKNLSQGNWGLLDLAARFSVKNWSTLLLRWSEAIMPPWLIGLGVLVGLTFFPAARRPVLGLAAVFLLAQLMFPFAYADQDYYFYACTVFLLGAIGLVANALLDSRLSRWCVWALVAVPFVAEIGTYWRGYRVVQNVRTNGGSPLTFVLHDLAPKDSVIIVAGADWAAIIPLYSGHKALMIRAGLEYDAAYLQRAFDDLADEKVSALVMVGALRDNRALIARIADQFDMDTAPTFSVPQADVFFNRPFVAAVQASLRMNNPYNGVTVPPATPGEVSARVPHEVSAEVAATTFAGVTPAPFQAYSTFGFGPATVGRDAVINAHPDCDAWIRVPEQATEIRWEFGINPGAYEGADGKTDGVEFIIVGEIAGGFRRRIFRQTLDPANKPADRGTQHAVIPFKPRPGEVLVFSTRPYLSASFDWAYWQRIVVK